MDKKRVTYQEIKKVSEEYIKRVFKKFLSKQSSVSDFFIDCPCCKKFRSMEYNQFRDSWECLMRDCGYTLPKELAPPSPKELKRLFTDILNPTRIKKLLSVYKNN